MSMGTPVIYFKIEVLLWQIFSEQSLNENLLCHFYFSGITLTSKDVKLTKLVQEILNDWLNFFPLSMQLLKLKLKQAKS